MFRTARKQVTADTHGRSSRVFSISRDADEKKGGNDECCGSLSVY